MIPHPLIMHPSVRAAIVPAFRKLEGYLRYMYLDVAGLVTTGMGDLIDSVDAAIRLPWRHGVHGPLATPAEVAAAWHLVKSRTDLDKRGGTAYETLTDLRLDDAAIEQLISAKVEENERTLAKRFPGYPSWPADAQLALHSMAWALGPWFNRPLFQAAVNAPVPNFTKAAVEGKIREEKNPGVVPRNAMNRALFANAAKTVRDGSPIDQLLFDVTELESILRGAAHEVGAVVEEAQRQVARHGTSAFLMLLVAGGVGLGLLHLAHPQAGEKS